MAESNEQVNFDGLHAPIFRIDRNDIYMALQPPDASPYVVANREMDSEFIIKFIQDRVPLIRELRADMLKRFEKSPSMECRYQTGDVAYLFGRPFMLRVSTLGKSKMKAGMHGRVNVNATMHNDVSLINLYVMQLGSYDQRRQAFNAWADGVFLQNARSVTDGCARAANITAAVPATVRTRDMPSAWCQMDAAHGVTWMSKRLAPYPWNAWPMRTWLRRRARCCPRMLPTRRAMRSSRQDAPRGNMQKPRWTTRTAPSRVNRIRRRPDIQC